MLGDVLKPKGFAGLFGAAPSVTLGIAVYQHGTGYGAVQAGSMMAGAVALAIYSAVVCQLLVRARVRALPATIMSVVVWLAAAIGLWVVAGGQA